jgi:hypothetical protein
MVFIALQEPFLCAHCKERVDPLAKGSYRNHCPYCLWSLHVDDIGPGDRKSHCHGPMEPTLLDQNGKKGWKILHHCRACGKEIWNKAAPDDDLLSFAEHMQEPMPRSCLQEKQNPDISSVHLQA